MNSRKTKNRMNQKAGFSLVELMVVVVIIGVLAAFSYPAYVNYVDRGRRAECASAIMQTANLLERYYTVNNTYTNDFSKIKGKNFSGSAQKGSACGLKIGASAGQTLAESFEIRGVSNFGDTKCRSLTYNHQNIKGNEGTADVATCWR